MHYQSKFGQTVKEILTPKIKEKIIVERAKLQSFVLNMAREGHLHSNYRGDIHEINQKYLTSQGVSVIPCAGPTPIWGIWSGGYYITINIPEKDLE